MLGKWEWIALRCEELGLSDAAEIAWEIDEHLSNIYGEVVTKAWVRDLDDICRRFQEAEDKVAILYEVAVNAQYCVACEIDKDCDTCKFGESCGVCDEDDSLFGRFMSSLLHRR